MAQSRAEGNPWGTASGFRVVGRAASAASAWVVTGLAEEPIEATLASSGSAWSLQIADGEPVELKIDAGAEGRIDIARGEHSRRFEVATQDATTWVAQGGQRFEVDVMSRLDWLAHAADATAQAQGAVRANMPGLVTAVHVEPGQRVKAGDVVAVMDSMKLIYSYEAAVSGEVLIVGCKVGDTVSGGQLLVEIAPDEAAA
ncbi:MAG: biotin carboxylase [Rhizobacter sp.]|nr:biotin carboxylase [Rhizobacter sp.]